MLSAYPKNQDVCIRMANVHTATIHSSSTIRPKNAESKDATKPTTLDARNVNTHSRREMAVSVESLTVFPCKTTTVLDVPQATT